jgi:negative regulator of flagellin synthesis FlgM
MPDPIRGVDTPNPVTPTTAPTTTGATGSTQSTDNTANATGTSAATAPAADLADVGQTEALLQNIIQAASNTPGIDQSKVAELQQAIASGTYQVNPDSIAQKLVELEGQLGTAGQLQ